MATRVVTLWWTAWLLYITSPWEQCLAWQMSNINSHSGHYPHRLCHLTSVVFTADTGTFHLKADAGKLRRECAAVMTVWDIRADPEMTSVHCDDVFDVGHVFTFYYYAGQSNYFHLHYDTMIPLFKSIYFSSKDSEQLTRLLMPTVEKSRLNSVAWDTQAFESPERYWNQALLTLKGSHTLLPLHDTLRASGKNICFKSVEFGTKRSDFSDKHLLSEFVEHVKTYFKVDRDAWKTNKRPKVGIISRANRRRILNEKELVDAVSDLAETNLIKLEKYSTKEQVELMQKYTVVAGMNGAGLMNAIYLPDHGVALQLVPYQGQVNHKEYGKLLAARGLYMVWHNEHEKNHHPVPGDTNNNRPDTLVDVNEFRKLVEDALKLAEKKAQSIYKNHETSKDEL